MPKVVVDPEGNEYHVKTIRGSTNDVVDLDTTSGTDNVTLTAPSNIFVSKYSVNGNYLGSKHVAAGPNFGASSTGVQIHDAEYINGNIFIAGVLGATSTDIQTNSGSATISNTSSPYIHGFFIRISSGLQYVDHYDIPKTRIQEIEPNTTEGGFFLGMAVIGAQDVDFMTSSTYTITSGSTTSDAVFAKYGGSSELIYAYQWSSNDQDAFLSYIHEDNNNVYLGYLFNSDESATSYDLNPTSGVDNVVLHQHDFSIIKLSKNGAYHWNFTPSSAPLVGQYTFLDDEYVMDFGLDGDGNIYLSAYSDSDAFKIGNTVYSKLVRSNNQYESFLIKLAPTGQIIWSKHIAALNSSSHNTAQYTLVDRINKRVLASYTVASAGVRIDGVEYRPSVTASSYRNLMVAYDYDGNVISAEYYDFGGSGTITRDSHNIEPTLYHSPLGFTRLIIGYNPVAASTRTVDLDLRDDGQTSVSASGDVRLVVRYNKSDPVRSLLSDSAGSPGWCTMMPPGLKSPWLFGAIPLTKNSVRLFIAPGDLPFTTYTLRYGHKSGEYVYGLADFEPPANWMMTVDELKPGTTYYFQVRAGNGCAPGNWSNEVVVKTKG